VRSRELLPLGILGVAIQGAIMVKIAIPVVAYFMLGSIALCFAECQSEVCKESTNDDFSLIQGFVEPDFVRAVGRAPARLALHAPTKCQQMFLQNS